MASETSAVVVAVRVRPFQARENPLLCCLTVPDSTTITATDVSPMLSATSTVTNARTTDKGGGLAMNSSSTSYETSFTLDAAGAGSTTSLGLVSHAFSFDKIFWSVPATVLPKPLSLLLEGSVEVAAEGGATSTQSNTNAIVGSCSSTMSGAGLTTMSSTAPLSTCNGNVNAHGRPSKSGSVNTAHSELPSAVFSALASPTSTVHHNNNMETEAHPYRASARPSIVSNSGMSSSAFMPTQASMGVPTTSNNSNALYTLKLHSALPCFAATPEYDTQASVYDFIGPRIHQAAMSGFNTCLFAYGQTGSGKTYSMIGPPEQQQQLALQHSDALGVMPRLCNDLFDLMHKEREADESVSYNVEVAFFEIYCEKVRDLLASTTSTTSSTINSGSSNTYGSDGHHGTGNVSSSPTWGAAGYSGNSLRVRQHPTRGPYVEGLTRHKVKNAAAVMRSLMIGLRDRATAETRMNEHSSRSHAIMQLYMTRVTVLNEEGAVVTKTRECKMSMVDLAGSERVSQSGATGERFEETRNINLSLSSLGRVIQQLSEKQAGKHVIPAYRDSVLTWLLSDSLGGNSKTIMLATIAPSAYCYQQTINTLRFAGVAKKIINVATVNEDRHFQQIITELRQQIVRLTLQLESGKASEAHLAELAALRAERDQLQRQNAAMQAKMATLVEPAVVLALRKRNEELEQDVGQLRLDKKTLQQRLVSTGNSLRAELARKEEQRSQLQQEVAQKEIEAKEWAKRFKQAVELAKTQTVALSATGTAERTGEDMGSNNITNNGSSGNVMMAARETTIVGNDRPGLMSLSSTLNSVTANNPAGPNTTTTNDGLSLAQLTALAAAIEGGELTSVGSAVDKALAQQQQQTLRKLRSRVHHLTQRLAAATRGEEEARDALREVQAQLAQAHSRHDDVTQRGAVLEEQLQSTLEQLQRTQNELATLQPLVATQAQDRAALSARESALLRQLEELRQDYFGEKQANVRLLLRVSGAEQERSQLKKLTAEQQVELGELEQLLLEETETSERYYLRMRYHRSMEELQRQYAQNAAYVLFKTRHNSLDLQAQQQQQQRGGGASRTRDDERRDSVLSASRMNDEGEEDDEEGGEVNALLASREAALMNAVDLTYAQLQYECISDESRRRVMIEQEHMIGVARLLARQAQLYRSEANAARRRVAEVEEQSEGLEHRVRQLSAQHAEMQAALGSTQAEMQSTREALDVMKTERLGLLRELNEAQAHAAEQERTANGLIEQLAEAQAGYEELRRRCAMAEAVAVKAQETLLRGHYVRADNTEEAVTATHNSNDNSNSNEENAATLAELEAATLQGKQRELHALEEELTWWKAQCTRYRGELGALHASVERETALRQSSESQAEANVAMLKQQVTRLQETKAQLMSDLDTTVRDYELRVKEQLEMIRTLRQALDEETQLADESRRAAQAARSSLDDTKEQLRTLQEELTALRAEQATSARRYRTATQELAELRTQYAAIERALQEMRAKEPEMYLLFDCNASQEGGSPGSWIDKARLERDKLEQQKREVRQLNMELMQQVQRQTSRLRTVQRQLNELSLQSEPASTTLTTDTSLETHTHSPSTQASAGITGQQQLPVDRGSNTLRPMQSVATPEVVNRSKEMLKAAAAGGSGGIQGRGNIAGPHGHRTQHGILTSDTATTITTDARSSLPSSIAPSQNSSTDK